MTSLKPVAVSGIGCICAAGMNLARCMEALFRKERNAGPPDPPPGKGMSAPVFQIRESIPFAEDHTLRTGRLALFATLEALADAGLDADNLPERRTGICIGTNVGSSMNHEAFFRDNPEGCDPYISPAEKFRISNPTIHIQSVLGLSGPALTVVNACSSGTDALGIAAGWIRTGLCDMVIAGGADEFYPITYSGFHSLLISDTGLCRPFDRDRKGLNLGEGAAVMILESEESLKKRRKKTRAYIIGYGSAADAFHLTAPRPDGNGLKLAIAEAFAVAGIEKKDIAFVNAHGTGTKDNDRIESAVLAEILPEVPFFSTKGYTGHTLGAAGAIEAAFSVACLERGEIPASIGFSEPDPDLPAHPSADPLKIKGRRAISQTLAFGGNNAVIILEKGPDL